jgi:hypothetical protein
LTDTHILGKNNDGLNINKNSISNYNKVKINKSTKTNSNKDKMSRIPISSFTNNRILYVNNNKP